jgi:hypothetical protein
MQAVSSYDSRRIASIIDRFTAPAYPGETSSIDLVDNSGLSHALDAMWSS